MPRFKFKDHTKEERVVTFDEATPRVTIGRLPENTIYIHSGSVSKRHARVTFEHGRWMICDLRSAGGIFFNGRRAGSHTFLLESGDRVKCGGFEFEFLDDDAWLGAARVGAGSFLMGSPDDELGRDSGEQQHAVRLTHDLWMAKTPVTVAQWNSLVAGTSGHAKSGDPKLPVVGVSWFDAVWACNELSKLKNFSPCYELLGMIGAPGAGLEFEEVHLLDPHTGYRLPTEAEWEYACRAGTPGPRYHDPLDQIAWYEANCSERMPVAQKLPNAWGLYDTLGNVWEWVWDWYTPSHPSAPATNPEGPPNGTARVLRGGAFHAKNPSWLRAAYRFAGKPSGLSPYLGFRWARARR